MKKTIRCRLGFHDVERIDTWCGSSTPLAAECPRCGERVAWAAPRGGEGWVYLNDIRAWMSPR